MIRAPAAIDFESFFRLSRDLMCVATADGYFERANDAWQRVLGYSIEELQSRPYIEFVHPDDRQATTAAAGRLAGNSEVVLFENRFRAKDGSYHWLVWNATVSPDGRYRYAVARDITERKAEEQQTRLFTSENPNPVLRIAADGTILFANPAGQLLLNHWHVRLHDKAPEELVSAVARTMSDTGRSSLEVQAGKGTFAFSIVRVLERGYTNLFGRDITDQKRIEEQYREAQRMEAIGRVAGGVAHDFNNLLSAILGFSAFLLKSLDPHDPRRADVEEIRATGERAAALTRQLLAFSRKQVIKPTVVDLNGVVSSMQKLIRRLLSEDIEMDLSLAPDLWPVKADLSQMEQVIMNLCVNARDAMPKGGKLSIRTENVVLDPTYSKLHFDTRPGEYAMIAVSDTGVGMTEEVRSHIFEPFFTTKREGKG
ncbi:MAG: PAS domain S-box protein, partial [Elusimicrobia bacterium]|nr:PAS domain S-box protein [Elusimicrobiota bacterium]